MGLFDFMKKKDFKKENGQKAFNALHALATPADDLEHLTKEGELPWGWHAHTKEFTDKINNEYSCFLHAWLETRNKSPREECAALKSFVLYLEDVEKLCKSKGECFEFWFHEILTGKGYIENRKHELEKLTLHIAL